MRTALVTLVVALVTSDCVRVTSVKLNPTAQHCPSVAPQQVRVFGSQQELDNLKVPYITLATLHNESSVLAADDKVVEGLRKTAAEMGANGVVMAQAGASGEVLAVQYGECVTNR